MAYLKTIMHARGVYKCEKCGKVINIGDTYKEGKRFRQSLIKRCMQCDLYDYELSDSEWIREIGSLVNEWDKKCKPKNAIEYIRKVLDTQRAHLTNAFTNVPKQFKNTAVTAQLIQDRFVMLDECEDKLSKIDYNKLWQNAEIIAMDLLADQYEDWGTDDFNVSECVAEIKRLTESLTDEEMTKRIDEALNELEY